VKRALVTCGAAATLAFALPASAQADKAEPSPATASPVAAKEPAADAATAPPNAAALPAAPTTAADAATAPPNAAALPAAPTSEADPSASSADPALPPPDVEAAAEVDALKLYGFLDFGFNRFFTSEKSQLNFLFPTKASTFLLGNINLFLDANPSPGWRSLVEIRFTNLPHGQERSFATPLGDEYERTDTRTTDFTSPALRSEILLGSIVIERAWAEYAFADAVKLQTGYFLTPYGIWNQDHGTPTLISLILPAFQADEYIPSRMLGVQLHGSLYVPGWQFGYHASLANGRGPSQIDLGEEKAFGGRVFATSLGTSVKPTFGASAYHGPDTNTQKRIVSVSPYRLEVEEVGHMHEWSVAADAAIDAGPVRLRTEGMVKRRYKVEGRPRLYDQPDAYYWDGYVLGAYALPWLGLEPYVYFEAMHSPSDLGDTVLIPSAGINVHFSAAAQLKTQYGHASFHDLSVKENRNPADNNVHNVSARLVVSF
jgi:hypothetical protein